MQIEILTMQMDKKTELLTMLSREPNLTATGDTLRISDLFLHITENYLLIKTTSLQWAERIIPKLFSIVKVSSAGQLYEPSTDLKIVLTAKSFDPQRLIDHLHEVNHLDMDNGELHGLRMVEWRSRDVAIVARAEIAVQGNIITSRLKFVSHFRDSEFNCQDCINQVCLKDIFKPISPEIKEPAPKLAISGPIIQSLSQVPADSWHSFIDSRPAPVKYIRSTETFILDFKHLGFIAFNLKDPKTVLCKIELNTPHVFDLNLLSSLNQNLGIKELTLTHTAENIILPPEDLMNVLGFKKASDFSKFALQNDNFKATYDIKALKLVLNSTINIINIANKDVVIKQVTDAFEAMQNFMDKVLAYANPTS